MRCIRASSITKVVFILLVVATAIAHAIAGASSTTLHVTRPEAQ